MSSQPPPQGPQQGGPEGGPDRPSFAEENAMRIASESLQHYDQASDTYHVSYGPPVPALVANAVRASAESNCFMMLLLLKRIPAVTAGVVRD